MLVKVLLFASVLEICTGLVMLIAPAMAVDLLLGASESPPSATTVRVFGIALLLLGLICWPRRKNVGGITFWMMLTYNVLIAAALAYLGAVKHVGGVLLWPGVMLHVLVSILLIWTWRTRLGIEHNKRSNQ